MSDPTLVVRVAANLSELKANMAEGLNQIETYKSALQRASSAYDGSRVVQQASAAAAAIQNAGGVTALTASEAAKANAVFSDAAAKLQLMGQGSSYSAQRFAELAEATKQVQKPTEDLGRSWVSRIAEGLLLRDAINEVLAQAKELIIGIPEEAHQLQLLSLQTQINVEDLQVLAAATREYGVDGDTLGRALFQLGKRIAGGDESVATAYHMMGLSLEEVKGKNALDLFVTTERGLGKLQGTLRDTAAADLYGGKLGASLGTFSTGVDEAIEQARRLNTIASKESVDAAAEYSKAIERATASLHALVLEQEGGAAQGFNVLSDAVSKGASKWDIAVAMLKDLAASSLSTGASTSNLAKVLDDLNQKTQHNTEVTSDQKKAHDDVTATITAQTAAFHFMAALELDSAKPLLDWQTEYLGHLKEIGELTAKNAAAIGVNADQFKRYEEQSRNAAAADKEWAAQQAAGLLEATRLQDEYNTLRVEHGGTATDAQIAQIHKWADDLTAKMQKAGSDTAEFYDATARVTAEKLAGVKVDWAALAAASKESLQQTFDRAQATYEAAQGSSLHFSSAAIQHFRDLRDAARAALFDVGTTTTSTFDSMNAAIMGIASSFAGWNKGIMASTDSMHGMSVATAALTGDINSQAKSVETLAGAWISAADAKKQFDQGNTLDIGTAAQDPAIMSLLKDGWSLKNAEAIRLSQQYGFTPQLYDSKGNPEATPSKDERVPGYASGVMNAPGGMAWVGERGPELMEVPRGANIYPTGTGPTGASVTMSPGAVQVTLNYPIMRDQRAMAEIADVIGEAFKKKLIALGWRQPSGA